MKKIIHIDMDAYYAALEIRENPALKGRCVIVGGSPNSRGVVSTCSYEARKYGVHSGMSAHQAWNLCPQGIFISNNFELYKSVSAQIREVFYEITDIVEPLSLDEAYLDVSENNFGWTDATEIARYIKRRILEETRLTCSAGVSYNKFLAKIASEYQKPDGLTEITPENALEILFQLPIGKFHGIGKVTAARMQKYGIHTGKELYEKDLAFLSRHFGKAGYFYYRVVRGIDERDIISHWEPKSVSAENTFDEDIGELTSLIEALKEICLRLTKRMQRKDLQGKSLVLKLKYDNFEIITRSMNLPIITGDYDTIYPFAEQLLVANWDVKRKVRLLGVGISKLDNPDEEQISIL